MDQWVERYRGILFFAFVAIALTGTVLFQILQPQPADVVLISPSPSPQPESTPTPRPLRVYISGAVRHPDVYSLGPDSIVKDAIEAAGGPTDEADLDRINLAAPVRDGQHVYVPHLGEKDLPVEPPANPSTSNGKININTADQSELETLPGIGPSIAGRICDHRETHGPFAQPKDIMDVSGIGPATFEKIRDLITTE